MSKLQNIVKGFCCRFVLVYHVTSISKPLLWNSFLTRLRFIRSPVWKYCHKPQNHRSLLVLWRIPSEGHFKALTVKLSHYKKKDGQFAQYCQTPLYVRFKLLFECVLLEWHFKALTVKFSGAPLPTKRWAIWKIVAQASESSLSASVRVSAYCKILP